MEMAKQIVGVAEAEMEIWEVVYSQLGAHLHDWQMEFSALQGKLDGLHLELVDAIEQVEHHFLKASHLEKASGCA